jgi:glycosyltransferase involved in cell wall biosynthesis
MANKLPVVAFNVGGISDWLKNGKTGLLAAPRDYLDLAEKINLLIEQPGLASSMGIAGRKIVEREFTPSVHIKRLVSIFQEVSNKISQLN